MRIVIFTVDHLYANLVLKELVNNLGSDIKLVVVSGVILHNSSLSSSLKKYLKISGLYYFLAQAIKLEIYKILSMIIKNNKNKFYSFKNLLNERKILIKKSSNVNDNNFITLLKKQKPDLIVSVFFNQILSPELLKYSKKGAVNIHPAFLPDYKGVSPVFWALVNNEKFSGVSVHWINNGIDTGGIIARKKIPVLKNDGEDSLYLRSAIAGADLLIKVINDIKERRVKVTSNAGGRYFSLPTKRAVDKFRKSNRNFFNLWEYIFK